MSENIEQNTYKITIDGVDYTRYIPMPVKWSSLLDERLDEGRLSLRNCLTPLFPPLSRVTIDFTDKQNTLTQLVFLVSADEATEIPVGSGHFNHELMLIEETKKLEGIIIDSLTYTNRLGRTYTDEARDISIQIVPDGKGPRPDNDKIANIKESLTPKLKGTSFTVMSLKSLFATYAAGILYQWDKAQLKVDFNGTTLYDYHEKKSEALPSTLDDNPYVISSLDSGVYSVEYYLDVRNGGDISIKYQFAAAANQQPLSKWTITDVIDRLLDLAEPHLVQEQPRYKLNEAQREEFSKIEAPEFAFSRMTLREALDQVGGYIHGMARLRGNEIYYDMLNGTEQAILSDPKYPYIMHRYTQNVESYATQLDSSVDNLVNILDSEEGVITEPYIGGYKTVRSEETYARITDGNMIISTSFPIYSITKIEVGPLPGGVAGGDITPYVFEAAEYGTMSSFEGPYPNSKAYAVYYTQGQKNVKGLSFKSPNVIGGAGAKYAIANIIKEVTGYDITPDWWSTLVNGEETAQNYPKLMFRITYTPIFSTRIQEHKVYYKDMHPRTLAYNQGANLIESRAYGENMRGAIARTGNLELERTYRLNDMSKFPKIGQMWGDDYFISSIRAAILPMFIDVTIGLSRDFNRLSQYIGINSSRRFYEVSEKQAYERDIVYSDYVIIGDAEQSDELQLLNDGVPTTEARGAVLDLRNTFCQDQNLASNKESGPVSAVTVHTLDSDRKQLGAATLPVVSTAMGNTLVFSFYMDNNYSAGEKSVFSSNGDVSGYWQTNVPYCDYYGRFEGMRLYYGKTGYTPIFDDAAATLLPQGSYAPRPLRAAVMATSDSNYILVKKDNREIIRFHYEVHFVSNRKDIILGPALTHNCPLVRGVRTGHSAALYVLKKKLGKFDSHIDLTTATMAFDYSTGSGITASHNGLTFDPQTAPVDGVGWAIADKTTGELLYGANSNITAGAAIGVSNFTITHNLYNRQVATA